MSVGNVKKLIADAYQPQKGQRSLDKREAKAIVQEASKNVDKQVVKVIADELGSNTNQRGTMTSGARDVFVDFVKDNLGLAPAEWRNKLKPATKADAEKTARLLEEYFEQNPVEREDEGPFRAFAYLFDSVPKVHKEDDGSYSIALAFDNSEGGFFYSDAQSALDFLMQSDENLRKFPWVKVRAYLTESGD